MKLRVGDIFKRSYVRGLFVVTGVTPYLVVLNYAKGDFAIGKELWFTKEYFLKSFRKLVEV